MNSLIWPELKLVQDFMALLVICKFEDDSIKSEGNFLRTTFSPLKVYEKMFCRSRASNFEVNSPIWPEIELVQDFIAVLVTQKYDEDPIKNKVGILRTRSNMVFFGTKGQVTGSKPEILSRIAQTTAALSRLKIIWRDKNISFASRLS